MTEKSKKKKEKAGLEKVKAKVEEEKTTEQLVDKPEENSEKTVESAKVKESSDEESLESDKTKDIEESSEETGAMDEEEYLKKTSKKQNIDYEEMAWKPKTETGRKVKKGELIDIDIILDRGEKIKEPEIVDILVPDLESDFLMIGQSKGKFGGGKRKIFRQTQKKTKEGNKPRFEISAIVGNKNGYVGLGYGKSKETVPAREKAIRNAKLGLIKIKRGCGSWQCGCKEPHSIPYQIKAKCGSVVITLRPAPKGTGLKIEQECGKILALAGIKDVWAEARGKTTTKINLVKACYDALKKLLELKVQERFNPELGIIEGKA